MILLLSYETVIARSGWGAVGRRVREVSCEQSRVSRARGLPKALDDPASSTATRYNAFAVTLDVR
jgi:hypothetical protein